MKTTLSTDEYRVLNWHIQMLMTLANDARSIAIHKRLYDKNLIEMTIKPIRLNPENASGFVESFKVVMAFLGCADGSVVTLPEYEQRIAAFRNRIDTLNMEVANLRSQLAVRDTQNDALCAVIRKSAEAIVRDMEVAQIPF